jgi:hypothetical protein
MNTDLTMTPDKLAAAGRALFGERWQTLLARDLRIGDRVLRRWLAGEARIPAGIETEVRALMIKRIEEMGGMLRFSVNPSSRQVYHYLTNACFQYDDAGVLTLLNPLMVAPEDLPLITAGAAEALRRERERDPRLAFSWVDQAGAGSGAGES